MDFISFRLWVKSRGCYRSPSLYHKPRIFNPRLSSFDSPYRGYVDPITRTLGHTFSQPLHNHSHDSLPSGSLPSLHPLMHEAKAAVEMQVRASQRHNVTTGIAVGHYAYATALSITKTCPSSESRIPPSTSGVGPAVIPYHLPNSGWRPEPHKDTCFLPITFPSYHIAAKVTMSVFARQIISFLGPENVAAAALCTGGFRRNLLALGVLMHGMSDGQW